MSAEWYSKATDFLSEMTPKQIQHHIRQVAIGALVSGLGVFIIAPVFAHAAYVFPEPTTSLPSYDTGVIPDVLNGSGNAQQKTGTLLVGDRNGSISRCTTNDSSGCSTLCLNPVMNGAQPVASDPVNCITSWTGLAQGLLTGSSFVRKLTTAPHIVPADYDSGAFTLQAATYDSNYPAAQLASLIASTPAGATPSTTPRPAGILAESIADANYAGQFVGKLAIVGSSALPSAHTIGLNGSYISNWSDIVVRQDPTIVRLQKLDYPEQIVPDVGSISINEAIVSLNGSVIAGTPTSATPISVSCGDGLCSPENGENSINCPNTINNVAVSGDCSP